MCATPTTFTTDNIGRAGAACAPGRVADEYSDWARRTLDGAGGGRVNEEAVQFLAEPPADLPAEVVKWRESGISRLVCGFLPDEVAWTTSGWDDDFAWFVAHWEFLPFRFSERVAAGRAECVVLATDSAAGVEPLCEIVAQAWADAAGLKLERRDTSRCDEATLVSALGRAALVVNDVQDWSLGFAIDELLARLGRPVLRLRQPGYSPLRYALLGVSLPNERGVSVEPLRGQLTAMIAPRWKVADRALIGAWYGERSAACWSSLFISPNAQRSGAELRHKNVATALGAPAWIDRPRSWMALTAAANPTLYPPEAFSRIGRQIAAWVFAPGRKSDGGAFVSAALPPLLLGQPGLVANLLEAGEGRSDIRRTVARWVRRAIETASVGIPILPLYRVVDFAWSENGAGREAVLVRTWLEGGAAPDTPAGPYHPIGSTWRVLCVEALFAALSARGARAVLEGLPSAVPGSDGDIWDCSFGGAAPLLWAWVAVRSGGRGMALRAFRAASLRSGMPSTPARRRVVRTALGSPDVIDDWARNAARQPACTTADLISGLAQRWARARQTSFWISPMNPQVSAEVRLVATSLDGVKAWLDTAGLHLAARLWAHLGRAEKVRPILRLHRERNKGNSGELPAAVAISLWRCGASAEARELLREFPQEDAASAFGVFLRAVAAQWLGDTREATAALAWLNLRSPGYLVNSDAGDSRWALAYAVFARGTAPQEAEAMRRIAEGFPATHYLFPLASGPSGTLAAGWLELLGPREDAR